MRIHFETFHVLQEPTYTGIVPQPRALNTRRGKSHRRTSIRGRLVECGNHVRGNLWMLQGGFHQIGRWAGGCWQ